MASRFRKSWVVNLAMIAALMEIAFLGKHYSPLLLPKADLIGVVEPGCDLQKRACPATVPGDRHLEFSITPRPEKVEVDFAGARMNMGYYRSKLAITTAGRYAGETSLPVCVSAAWPGWPR